MSPRAALLLSLFACHAVTAGGVYKWQDQHGAVQYSDTLPQANLPGGVSQLNRDGMVIRKAESAQEKMLRESAAAQQQRAQAQWRLQQHYDHLLLERFRSPRDIELARDAELQRLAPVLASLATQQQQSRQRLARLQAEAGTLQQQGKPLQGLPSQISEQQRLLASLGNQLQSRQDDMARLRQKAEQDRQRLQQLLTTTSR